MKYSEIFDYVYSESTGISNRVNSISKSDYVSWNILKSIISRRGFSQVWDGIDSDIQDDIFSVIRAIVEEEL